MKSIILTAMVVIATAMSAQKAVPVEGFPFCQTRASLDTFVKSIMDKDEATVVYYMSLDVCGMFNGNGTTVYINEYHSWGTIVEFRLSGKTFYTVTEGLKKQQP